MKYMYSHLSLYVSYHRLVAITCVLALSNLGTSFAAAWLSKDTKSVDGALVDKASGQTIKTDTYANVYTGIDDANRRELCEEDTDGIGIFYSCSSGIIDLWFILVHVQNFCSE